MNFSRPQKLGDHHEMRQMLGEGGFGKVFACYNQTKCQMEAVKLIKRCPHAKKFAKKEIEILEQLRAVNHASCGIVTFYESFLYRDVICLSFELLDQDLFSYMKEFNVRSGFCGLPLEDVSDITRQLLTALNTMSSAHVIHCDIKPKNIMVVDRQQRPVTVKLVDFGGAKSLDMGGKLLQTLRYSSPEVLVGCNYTMAIDMWALGVTVAEMVLGQPLYKGKDNYDMLRRIIQSQGMLPGELLDSGNHTHKYFSQVVSQKTMWKLKTVEEFDCSSKYEDEDDFKRVNSLDDLGKECWVQNQRSLNPCIFVQLIKRMLHLDPQQRITANEALQHQFFKSDCKIPAVAQNTKPKDIGDI